MACSGSPLRNRFGLGFGEDGSESSYRRINLMSEDNGMCQLDDCSWADIETGKRYSCNGRQPRAGFVSRFSSWVLDKYNGIFAID